MTDNEKPRIRVHSGQPFVIPEQRRESNIRILPGFGGRDPYAMLEAARNGAEIKEVTIVGRDVDGQLWLSSSHRYRSDTMYDLRAAENILL